MIIKDIKIFSQNMWKNNLIVNIILKTQFSFDIIFIQELLWITICLVPSSKSKEEEELVGILNHSSWLIFSRNLSSANDSLRAITYINIRLLSFWFSLHKDIFNHRDISLVLFFNNNNTFFLMNIYSDSSQLALKYLKDTKANIYNILVMTGNFNIGDNLWNSYYLHHFIHSDLLFDIADFFFLGLSISTNWVPTRYSDNN